MTKHHRDAEEITPQTGAVRDRETVIERECAGCGIRISYAGRGRRARYCSHACRQRAWALRTAERQLGTDTDPRPRVVREVVERERVVVRPGPVSGARLNVPAPSPPTPPTPPAPTRARDWAELLTALEEQLATPEHATARHHWEHRRLYAALAGVVTALGKAHPGGLDALAGSAGRR